MNVCRASVNDLGSVTVTPAVDWTRVWMVVVLSAEAAQLNFALVQFVLLPVTAQKFQRETLYKSARPRSAAVMFTDVAVAAALPRAALFRAVVVRPEKWSDLLRMFLRFCRSEEEMERFFVLTSKRSKFLFEIPDSMTIKMQTRLAKVKPNGKPTQTNLPKPILSLSLY